MSETNPTTFTVKLGHGQEPLAFSSLDSLKQWAKEERAFWQFLKSERRQGVLCHQMWSITDSNLEQIIRGIDDHDNAPAVKKVNQGTIAVRPVLVARLVGVSRRYCGRQEGNPRVPCLIELAGQRQASSSANPLHILRDVRRQTGIQFRSTCGLS